MTSPSPPPPAPLPGALEVYLLGLVDFDAAIAVQERLMRDAAGYEDGRGALLVCEHPPLITVGRSGSRSELRCPPEELTARRISLRWLNRGGGSIVHSPGQLVVYAVLPVARRGWGLVDLRDRLQGALLETCHDFQIQPEYHPETASIVGRTGVLAHLGVAVRSGISSHGLFINVSAWGDTQRLVREGAGRTSTLTAERGAPVAMPAVRESVIRHLAARLDYERYHLYTGHPLLKRTQRVVAYA